MSEERYWQEKCREQYDAFCAMRNDINETGIPVRSADAVLLSGPEFGHDCEALAEDIITAWNTRQAPNDCLMCDGTGYERIGVTTEMSKPCSYCTRQAPKVKALEWEVETLEYDIRSKDHILTKSPTSRHWIAKIKALNLRYEVVKILHPSAAKASPDYYLSIGSGYGGQVAYEELEAAFAAAQADYERRILSALEE